MLEESATFSALANTLLSRSHGLGLVEMTGSSSCYVTRAATGGGGVVQKC